MRLLEGLGAKVVYNDPHVAGIKWHNNVRRSVKLTAPLLRKSDLVVIVTNHSDYDYKWIVENSQLVFDTRNAANYVKTGRKKIVKL
jgi:UDP-N-acetyl-D-glucosamine dehydrogenase